MSDWADEKAEAAVARIFEDLRDRRFLKWLFKEDVDAEHCIQRDGPVYALEKDVQDEIAATWAGICAIALREAHEAGRREGIERAERLLGKEADEWREAERHFEDHGEGAEALYRWWAGKGVREALDTLRALAQEGVARG